MHRLLILIVLWLSTANLSVAQNGYERVQGGAQADWLHYVLPVSDSGVVACGGTRSFGFGDITNYDGYVVKLNSEGDTLWTRHFGTTGLDEGLNIIETDSGYLVTGYISSNGYDVYAVQYDADGNQLWEGFYGGTAYENGLGATSGPHKQAIICGLTTSYTNGGSDFYAVKIDSAGNQISDTHFGGAGNESALGVTRTSDGGYAFIGYSSSTDPNYNVYVVKADSDLNFLWSKDFGGGYEDLGLDIVEDASQNLWLLGYETISPDSSYMVLIQTDANGENAVTHYPGAHAGDLGNSIRKTPDGGFLIGGVKSISGKSGEMLLEKLNADGDTLWTRHFGGLKNEYGYGVASDAGGNIYLAGETEGFGVSQFDAYLVKLDSLGNTPCPSAVSFTSSNGEICEDENVFFTNTTVSSQSFSWFIDGNEFSDNIDAGYYFPESGNFSVVLDACSNSSSQDIIVNAKPSTYFTYSATGTTVNFVLDPGIDVQSISWNFGDGSPLNTTEENPSHTYPAVFPYWVTVSVTNSAGCDSAYTEQIDLPTGIDNISISDITLFPNPATDKIFVRGNLLPSVSKIMILNIDGREERSVICSKRIEEISVADLVPGIYFLKFTAMTGASVLCRFEVY